MRKNLFAAALHLSFFIFHFSPLLAEDVVKLEPTAGAAGEYNVTELLRVELMGDSIRFIASNEDKMVEILQNCDMSLVITVKE